MSPKNEKKKLNKTLNTSAYNSFGIQVLWLLIHICCETVSLIVNCKLVVKKKWGIYHKTTLNIVFLKLRLCVGIVKWKH